MFDALLDQLDQFGRRHSRLMLAATVVALIVTTLILLYKSTDTAIVYEAF